MANLKPCETSRGFAFVAGMRSGDLSGLWRYRVGDFMLLAKLEDAILTAVIIKAGHRSVIYED